MAPGVGFAAVGVAVALVGAHLIDAVSPLVLAVALGTLAGNVGVVPAAATPGLAFVARRCLRLGVVLLGLRLAFGDILDLGIRGIVSVLAVVTLTFVGTRWFARRLGLTDGQGLLVATGFSICGLSAIAAMDGVADTDEDDVAIAVALVTLCGTLAIFVLPLVGTWIGIDDVTFGAWAGASVHDVAQVVATASNVSSESVTSAITVKLSRVVLLAPLVVGVSLWIRRDDRRRADAAAAADPGRADVDRSDHAGHMTPVPLFVVGFLGCALVRSSGVLDQEVLDVGRDVETVLFTAAMVALGAGVRLARLRVLGVRPLVLGLSSWVLVAALGLAAAEIVHNV